MGSKCACLKPSASEDTQIIIENEETHTKLPSTHSFTHKNSIVPLQSLLRGYLHRKGFTPKPSSKFFKGTRQSFQEIPQIPPNFLTHSTLSIESRLGAFIFPPHPYDSSLLISKPAIQLENGAIYKGEWNQKWEREGKGVQIWSDGSKYEGYWFEDRAEGKGRLIHSDGAVYEGDWVKDMANGYGVLTHSDGSYYEGCWVEDKQHGFGHEVWPDGSSYKGNYANGLKSGFGTFNWADGSCYQGEFSLNSIHGFGKYNWSDGRAFVGYWQDGKMHGKGEFTWPDNRRYCGDYVNDKKEGFGVFQWPEGKSYEGFWLDGKQHGTGIVGINTIKTHELWFEGKRVNN